MIVEVVWASIVRACNDLIDEIRADPAYMSDLQFIDWENVVNEDELPNVDLLGPTSLGVFEESPNMISVSFSIAGSTYGEKKNLFRHRKLMGKIFERVRVLNKISLLHPTTGTPMGYLTVLDGMTLSPMTRSKLRPFQFVHVQAGSQAE